MSQPVYPDRSNDQAAAAAADRGAALVIGERVHNYEVVSKIGQGGMGAVYLASHQFFERKAALKVLHPHLSGDENSVRRFMNEARAANAIRHPNIIEVVDTGFLPRSGAPYLLTEYLEGENLAARLRRLSRLPFDTALQIAGQVASALAAAHDQGIVHRDLKPENLFLLPRPGNADLVKVLDFGIAKLRMDLAGAQIETLPGMIVGTPRYMSPEQCRAGAAIDHRTDIYSLGLILYEMVCGVRAFDSGDIVSLMTQHLTQPPAPPRSHVPDVPLYVQDAVLCALQKQPSDRFESMRDLRLALGSAAIPRVSTTPGLTVDQHPPAAQTWGGNVTGRAPGVKQRGGTLAPIAVLLVLVGGGAVAFWKSRFGPAGGPVPASARSEPDPTGQEARAGFDPAGTAAPGPGGPSIPAAREELPPVAAEATLAPAAVAEARRSPPRSQRTLRRAELATGRKERPKEMAPLPSPSPAAADGTPKVAPKKFVPPLW